MTYNIREAMLEDSIALAPLLREADKSEVAAMSGMLPADALAYSIMESEKSYFVSLPDGSPLALFGIGRSDTIGVPWLLGTDSIKHYAKSLIKEGRKWIEAQMDNHNVLMNYVDARNVDHINWLLVMGFKVVLKELYVGHDKSVPFLLFYRSN